MKDHFVTEIQSCTDEIELRRATTTARHGKAKLRDRLVFIKVAWNESASYVSFIQTIIIFTALIPTSLITINGAFLFFGKLLGFSSPYQLPLEISSIFAFLFVIAVMLFGFIAMRYIGTYRSSQELSAQMNPGNRLLWKKDEEILQRLERIEQSLNEIRSVRK